MEFDNIFDNATAEEEEFDTIFGGNEDGELIDACCGFNESGECVTDFDEIHQEPGDADREDFENDLRVDDETDNAPSGAEGTDSDPAIDLAMGETAGKEFSAVGVKGKTDSDDFYDDYNEPEEPSALTGEGPDVNMDNENIDDEFDKMVESCCKETEDEGLTDEDDKGEESFDTDTSALEDDGPTLEAMLGITSDDTSINESDEYEEGDSDLVDLVAGGGEY